MLDRKTNIGLEVGKEDYRRLNGERERDTHTDTDRQMKSIIFNNL